GASPPDGAGRPPQGLRVGDELHLTHPQNDFALDPDADRHLMVAGGIGVTPLLGMLLDLPRGRRRNCATACGREPTRCSSTGCGGWPT
ncbi:hypothetical protein AB0G02_40955, partial [Actinosynnema sp. NPDC023658]